MKKVYLATILFIIFAFLSNVPLSSAQVVGQAVILPNHTGYLDLTTIPITYHVVGEVINIGTVSLTLLNITATFYDQNNATIGLCSSYVLLNVLLPGRKAPFEVVWNDIKADQTYNYSLSLRFREYISEKPLAIQLLENTTYIDEAGFQKINGTIKNLASQNATYVKVIATFYNVDGKVMGVAYTYTMPSTIMPNQTAPFELELKRKGLFFPNYSLTAESSEYSLIPELSALHLYSLLLISLLITLTVHRKRTKLKLHNIPKI
jgi:hypothetical protein